MKICFYDVSSSQELAHLNGQQMTFGELFDHHVACRSSFQELALDREKLSAMAFQPYGEGENGWKGWLMYFTTAIQLITGQTPTKDETQIAKGFVMEFSRHFKERYVDHRFVMCFLPYLFAGFKVHRTWWRFVADSNTVKDVRVFVEALFGTERVMFTSFLCAHRDPKIGPGLNLLQGNIPPEKIRRAASLLLGLTHNAKETVYGESLFLQQGPSMYASSSIFPEVSVAYFESGRAHEMISRLQYQYDLVNKTLQSVPGERVHSRLISLDMFMWRLDAFLADRYGKNWRQLNFFPYREYDPLVEIAIKMVLPSIKRLMPFFSGNFQQSFLAKEEKLVRLNYDSAYIIGGLKQAELAGRLVQWFIRQHSMSACAKAIHEAAFYYLWGKYSCMSDKIFAVGLDRDHEEYQHAAWKLGAESNKYMFRKAPRALLYARRNPNEQTAGSLSDLSFRQFWRYET